VLQSSARASFNLSQAHKSGTLNSPSGSSGDVSGRHQSPTHASLHSAAGISTSSTTGTGLQVFTDAPYNGSTLDPVTGAERWPPTAPSPGSHGQQTQTQKEIAKLQLSLEEAHLQREAVERCATHFILLGLFIKYLEATSLIFL
jgi:hypothetical protein